MTERSRRRVLHYEHRSQPIIPRRLFVRRILYHAMLAFAVVSVSLVIGVLGYRFFAGLSWIDALMNAAMILGGMGPVNELSTASGKLFASFYALYAGVAFLAIAAVLIAPFAHRLLHTFIWRTPTEKTSLHLETPDTSTEPTRPSPAGPRRRRKTGGSPTWKDRRRPSRCPVDHSCGDPSNGERRRPL